MTESRCQRRYTSVAISSGRLTWVQSSPERFLLASYQCSAGADLTDGADPIARLAGFGDGDRTVMCLHVIRVRYIPCAYPRRTLHQHSPEFPLCIACYASIFGIAPDRLAYRIDLLMRYVNS